MVMGKGKIMCLFKNNLFNFFTENILKYTYI